VRIADIPFLIFLSLPIFLKFIHLCDGAQVAHEWALLALPAADLGSSEATGEGASFRGGMRSLMASKPLASSKEVILWFGENP
jgi:hypothetical protein